MGRYHLVGHHFRPGSSSECLNQERSHDEQQDGRCSGNGPIAELEPPRPLITSQPAGLTRWAQVCAKFALQFGRRFKIRELRFDGSMQVLMLPVNRAACIALDEVTFEFQRARDIELSIDVGIQEFVYLRATHAEAFPVVPTSRPYSSLRARERRDITVPKGISTIAAMSLYDSSSNSRRINISRYS